MPGRGRPSGGLRPMVPNRDDQLLGELLDSSHAISMQQIPVVVADTAGRAGYRDAVIFLADIQQSVLRPLRGRDAQEPPHIRCAPTEIRVEGTLAGRAFQNVAGVQGPAADGGGTVWWVPILDGIERLGVLKIVAPPGDADVLPFLWRLAGLVGLMVVSKRALSDTYAQLLRTQPMTVSAEMQWRLMPPRTFANDRVVIGALLEPAYELGGDAFDYGLAGDIVHLAIFDAMGHDTTSGLTSNLAVATCRNSRLQGADLLETGKAIEEILERQFAATSYVTALLARLDSRTGMLTWTNHGHPAPVVIRNGRWVTILECPPAAPLGTGLGNDAVLCQEQLEPGDRILLYTDGIIEARNSSGQEFGLHRFVDFIIRHNADGLPVPETLRRLVRSILEHHAGRLDDDASVLLLEWRGPDGRIPPRGPAPGLRGSWPAAEA